MCRGSGPGRAAPDILTIIKSGTDSRGEGVPGASIMESSREEAQRDVSSDQWLIIRLHYKAQRQVSEGNVDVIIA